MRSFLFAGVVRLALASESDVCAAAGECMQDEATLLQMEGLRNKNKIASLLQVSAEDETGDEAGKETDEETSDATSSASRRRQCRRRSCPPSRGDRGQAEYVGCFRDDGNRDLSVMMGNNDNAATNTFDGCRQACGNDYQYMSLQYGGECFCSNSFGTGDQYYPIPDSECTSKQTQPCYSDSFSCGSDWANAVYFINTWDDEPRILTAIAGMPKCFGVANYNTGVSYGCATTSFVDCQGQQQNLLGAQCITPQQATLACLGQGLTNNTAQDATPVTFNWPVAVNTVNYAYFQYNFDDGTSNLASCAQAGAAPCNEGNELQTIAISGDAGGWTGFATSVEIVGPLMLTSPDGTQVSAEGLTYSGPSLDVQNGPILLTVTYETFSSANEMTAQNGAQYPNHCQALFPDTTHRLRLLFNGGVTYDGYRPITPDHVALFEIQTANAGVFPAGNVLGLADLGATIPVDQCDKDTYVTDLDNYVDICLRMDSGTPLPKNVYMPCDVSAGTALANPKGANYPCSPQTVPVRT